MSACQQLRTTQLCQPTVGSQRLFKLRVSEVYNYSYVDTVSAKSISPCTHSQQLHGHVNLRKSLQKRFLLVPVECFD